MKKFSYLDYIKANVTIVLPFMFALFLVIVGIFAKILITLALGSVVVSYIIVGSIVDWKRKKNFIEKDDV